jgi:hypothetical protein
MCFIWNQLLQISKLLRTHLQVNKPSISLHLIWRPVPAWSVGPYLLICVRTVFSTDLSLCDWLLGYLTTLFYLRILRIIEWDRKMIIIGGYVGIKKEAFMAYFNTTSRHRPEQTEDNNGKPQAAQPVLAKIRTVYFPNKSLERFPHTIVHSSRAGRGEHVGGSCRI